MAVTERPSLEQLASVHSNLADLENNPALDASIHPSAILERLPDRYFAVYTDPFTIARHLELIASLSKEEPYALEPRQLRDSADEESGRYELTIVTVDDPGMLSLLAGILGAQGFDITRGELFTLERRRSASSGVRSRRRTRRGHASSFAHTGLLSSRRIVDRFVGTLEPGQGAAEFFQEITSRLDQVLPLVIAGQDVTTARRIVNEAVAERLAASAPLPAEPLLPLEIEFGFAASGRSSMVIRGEDTPFFLYSLAASLSLQNISIESVSIHTDGHVVRDELEFVDRSGEPVVDQARLDSIRFSVLFTKQLTYFLDRAPDPYSALVRFESLVRELVAQSTGDGIQSLLSSPDVLAELAQLLGASDFLWEDFIRLQYESIIPTLQAGTLRSRDRKQLEELVSRELANAATQSERVDALNEIKDREAYLIDLDHILSPDRDFFFLSSRLSDLAEIVVEAALRIAWDSVAERYGTPRGVAGLDSEWAVFGLGKLGGRAIGYASDIELMLVYRDAGVSSGPEQISNAEFFERFFTEATGYIRAKREGIFHVDLRLRPYGKGGPHAVSLESFNRYYGRDGDAHSFELLALTRLRALTGTGSFGREVELLRDDLVYAADSIDLTELRDLRERQVREKSRPGMLNAKFSPGALVDLEYGLQILLVSEGRTNERLRTQSLHAGLEEFGRTGYLDPDEAARLERAYRFLRRLINGLRMLRGDATDLFLPPLESLEYRHLARRLGYARDGDLSAEEQLHVEFEARTAAVRAFLERHLGHRSVPGGPVGNAADLVLSDELDPEVVDAVFERARIRDRRRATINIKSIAASGDCRELFAELIILVWQALAQNIDPDVALNNWDRYVTQLADRVSHFRHLLRQPRVLDLMLQVFATSSFLSETLIGRPETLAWALDAGVVRQPRLTQEIAADLNANGIQLAGAEERRRLIRRQRRRELLRIGTRDICLKEPMETITKELSSLAAAVIQTDLLAIWREVGASEDEQRRFVLLAFGKQGGWELNYSSDIDLLGIYDDRSDSSGHVPEMDRSASLYPDVLQRLREDLTRHTEDGHAYRLDFRLRPYGSAGPLVPSWSAALAYYENRAADWEHQALIKVSPVAGNVDLGAEFLAALMPHSVARFATADVRGTIARLREQAVQKSRSGDDIKNGVGGIRDIEFLVQGLQMSNASRDRSILHGNTLQAIESLVSIDALDPTSARELMDDYRRFRKVEHLLQIHDDQQVHTIPHDGRGLTILARRLDGPDSDGQSLARDLEIRRSRTRERFLRFVREERPTRPQIDA